MVLHFVSHYDPFVLVIVNSYNYAFVTKHNKTKHVNQILLTTHFIAFLIVYIYSYKMSYINLFVPFYAILRNKSVYRNLAHQITIIYLWSKSVHHSKSTYDHLIYARFRCNIVECRCQSENY